MERELKKTLKIVVLGDKNTGKTGVCVFCMLYEL